MRSKLLAGAMALALTTGVTGAFAADVYKMDPAHTYVGFEVDHFGYAAMIATSTRPMASSRSTGLPLRVRRSR